MKKHIVIFICLGALVCFARSRVCTKCHGTKRITEEEPCEVCNGEGFLYQETRNAALFDLNASDWQKPVKKSFRPCPACRRYGTKLINNPMRPGTNVTVSKGCKRVRVTCDLCDGTGRISD